MSEGLKCDLCGSDKRELYHLADRQFCFWCHEEVKLKGYWAAKTKRRRGV